MDPLLNIMKESNTYLNYIEKLKEEREGSRKPIQLTGLSKFGKAQIAYATLKEFNTNIYYIVPSTKIMEEIYNDFKYFGDNVYVLPEKDIANVDTISQDMENYFQRMNTLEKILHGKNPKVIITTIEAMMQEITPVELLEKSNMTLKVNMQIDMNELLEKLTKLGYMRVDVADIESSFSVRGGIVDIAESEKYGFRIEFWGDDITSIRKYDLKTQKSIEELKEVKIYSASEYFLQRSLKEITDNILNEIQVSNDAMEIVRREVEDILEGNYTNYVEKYWSYFYKNPSTIIDLIGKDDIVILDNKSKLNDTSNGKIKTLNLQNEQLLFNKGKIPVDSFNHLMKYEEIINKIIEKENNVIYIDEISRSFIDKHSMHAKRNEYSFSYREVNFFRFELDNLLKEIEELGNDNNNKQRIILLCGEILEETYNYLTAKMKANNIKTKIRKEFIYSNSDDKKEKVNQKNKKEANEKYTLEPGVYIKDGRITEGFEIPDLNFKVIYIENIIVRKENVSVNKKKKAEELIFTDLKPGDYVVHNINGIGKFIEITQVEAYGTKKDYIKLEYRDNDFLYIPVDDLSNVKKYIGSDITTPRLSKLGTKDWEKTKERVKKSLKEVAEELVKLYAEREKIQGYKFSKDTSWQQEFEDSFPFIETEDQIRCTNEIKKDMESIKPMDRLLCGDVGFGKTEVAMRAAFKAVMDGKQVVYIAPTTVLVHQQFESFSQRFKDYPVAIDEMSRFKTPSEQKVAIEQLKKGQIDIIIGTHRLLSKDVQFKNLGLLIIDEEHRFGVKAKEKIKTMKHEIDVLTMSATPIPRTMHMSLSGIRDMSVIYDPPMNRKPVKTYIVEEDDDIIRSVILNEIKRNGQVIFLHNKVRDIESKTEKLKKLVPEAEFDYANGQMTSKTLEKQMQKFISGEIDVLVSTTIIESGIDIPNVNTVIIEDADKMGLAQLYQIRGRVGRSDKEAYAYIMFKKQKRLTEIAEKRLKAIREFTELGSGYRIAMRDMQIRGAGNLFGEVQHGHMEQVGYDMYNKLLKEAVEEIQAKETGKKELNDIMKKLNQKYNVNIDLNIDSYIPDSYVNEQQYSMDIYQKLVGTKDNNEVIEVTKEIEDIYGKMPKEVRNFVKTIIIRNLAYEKGVSKILELSSENIARQIHIFFNDSFDRENMEILIKKFGTNISFRETKEENSVGKIVFNVKDNTEIIKATYGFLKILKEKKNYEEEKVEEIEKDKR